MLLCVYLTNVLISLQEEKTFSDCRLRVGVVEKHDLINSKNQAYNCLPTHYNFDWLGYIDREKK
jgi:hypothetical protein